MTHFCRACSAPLRFSFANLGCTPLANSYLQPNEAAIKKEKSYPLHVKFCEQCFLVQVEEAVPSEAIFDHDYAYLSSYSKSWVEHAKDYAAKMTKRFGLDQNSFIMEIASNDGYLLQHFVAHNMPVLGIEPAGHAAELARAKGVETRIEFFHEESALKLKEEGIKASLIAANNVLAHVPDIKSFIKGFPHILSVEGVLTFEFPHLLNLIEKAQFDTIYHEHYSYLSLLVVERLLNEVGLRVFDIEFLPTHGGSLRVFACHQQALHEQTSHVETCHNLEKAAKLDTCEGYQNFDAKIKTICKEFTNFVTECQVSNKKLIGYGAAAKGNTFLNVCAIGSDVFDCVVDQNPEKQNTLLPGSHIPVLSPDIIRERKPDYLVIFPWNLKREIMQSHAYIREWGGRFVTAIPKLEIV